MTTLQDENHSLKRQVKLLTANDSMQAMLDRVATLEQVINEIAVENSSPEKRVLCAEWGFTDTETRIFIALHDNRPTSITHLMHCIYSLKHWSDETYPVSNIISIMICKMRKKMTGHNATMTIKCDWGVGFHLEVQS